MPHLDLAWPTVGVDVAKTALGSSGTMAALQTAMRNQYYRLLQKDSDLVSLLCLRSIKQGPGVIYSGHDALHMPEEPGRDIYKKSPLEFHNETHYFLPFDRIDHEDSTRYEGRIRVLEEYRMVAQGY